MVIMKQIRNLKISLLQIEDDEDKVDINDQIRVLTTRLINLKEEDVIVDTVVTTKNTEEEKGEKEDHKEEKKSKGSKLNRIKSAAKVVTATSSKKKGDKCIVQ